MGTGASTGVGASKGQSAMRVGQEGVGGGGSVGSGGGTTTHLDVVEGGVQWLAGSIETEKREKEWLAGKYDAKCEEVKALQHEIKQLRQELMEARQGLPAGGSSASHTGASRPENPDGASPVASPTGGGLMGRRGLKLGGLETSGKKQSRVPGHRVSISSPISPVKEEPNPAKDSDEELPPEPMSALLRRRAEDWKVGPGSPMSGGTSSPSSLMILEMKKAEQGTSSAGLKNLTVQSQKVFSMVGEEEECPASPKRVTSRATKQRNSLGGGLRDRSKDKLDIGSASMPVCMFAGSGGTD